MLDHRFDDTIAAWNVDIRFRQPLDAPSALAVGRKGSRLALRRAQGNPEARFEAATRLSFLELGHAIRIPAEEWTKAEQRAARLHAARRLIPDAARVYLDLGEDFDEQRMAWDYNVPVYAVRLRIADWLGLAPFF